MDHCTMDCARLPVPQMPSLNDAHSFDVDIPLRSTGAGVEAVPHSILPGHGSKMNLVVSIFKHMHTKGQNYLFSKSHSFILLNALDLCKNNHLGQPVEDWNFIQCSRSMGNFPDALGGNPNKELSVTIKP